MKNMKNNPKKESVPMCQTMGRCKYLKGAKYDE